MKIPNELYEIKFGIKFTIAVIFYMALFFCAVCHAQTINVPIVADSIYLAEGGSKTHHPYGIMLKYRITTPRQACINTIEHRLKMWNGQGEFIVFLGKTYSPPSINPYWVKNVRWFYGSKIARLR